MIYHDKFHDKKMNNHDKFSIIYTYKNMKINNKKPRKYRRLNRICEVC